MNLPVYLSKVAIKDYKSIASCDVELEPLTFLVGPNGGGKSNFLDALRFCADALRYSLDQAIRDRGGINEVRRRSAGRPNHFGVRLTIEVRPSYRFQYHFEIGARTGGTYAVQREECEWQDAQAPDDRGSFAVKNGAVVHCSIKNAPPAASDRLYLVTMSGFPRLDVLYRALSSMGFYNLNPERIRDLQSPDPGDLLVRDGSNLAAVFDTLARHDRERADRVLEFLRLVVPGIESVQSRALGPKETLEFVERASPEEKNRKFLASSMSDGTLRALGVIVALFQRPMSGIAIPVVGIEEPEMALHPAAAGVLLDCLREAAKTRQVIVTSHSPDLLDRSDIPVESILAVSVEDGRTFIGPVNEAGKRILGKRLRTPGELMRINQMEPDWSRIPASAELQMRLFR
jgi:predicted ATPase